MNERTIKLYEEATEFAYESVGKEHSDKSYFQAAIAGKFAELIVRECINVVAVERDRQLMEFYSNEQQNVSRFQGLTGTFFTVDAIKKHFGVEE
jgi:hypothetical protein